jgi:hydrogenase nickel incorporation protein HypA/HybF
MVDRRNRVDGKAKKRKSINGEQRFLSTSYLILRSSILSSEGYMHEMAIVQSIMDIIEQQAEMYNAKRVVRVSLEFGALTAVLPAAVSFAFEILSKDGIAEGAQLDIKIVPIKVQCKECGNEQIMENYEPFCPVCSSPALNIVEGRDEMRIVSLEIEDS